MSCISLLLIFINIRLSSTTPIIFVSHFTFPIGFDTRHPLFLDYNVLISGILMNAHSVPDTPSLWLAQCIGELLLPCAFSDTLSAV